MFGISTLSDDKTVHPQHFCHACKIVLFKASSSLKPYQHRTVVFEGWCNHTEASCTVCDYYLTIQQGGRPKKSKRHSPGRPPSISPRYCIDHILKVAPLSFAPSFEGNAFCEHHQPLTLSEVICPGCCEILQRPVELVTCGSYVCAECLCLWLQHKGELECPCCCGDHLREYNTIVTPAALVLRLLGSLCVICSKCQRQVKLDQFKDHTESSCTTYCHLVSPDTSIDDVLKQPLTSPLTAVEQKLQTSLARRTLSGSPEENVLHLKTGGRVRRTYSYTHNENVQYFHVPIIWF